MEVEAAENAFGGGALVVLNKGVAEAGVFKILVGVGFHEVAARVTEDFGSNNVDAVDGGWFKSEHD